MKQLLPKLKIKQWLRLDKRRNLLLLAVLVVFVLGVVASLYLYVDNKKNKDEKSKKVDCVQVAQSVDSMLEQQKYAEAYNKLKTQIESCGLDNDTVYVKSVQEGVSDDSVKSFIYSYNLAKAAYKAGDKEQAGNFSRRASTLANMMTWQQRSSLPNYDQIVFDLDRITNGLYDTKPEDMPKNEQ